jgi:transcriptional regulator with XRE-family HTH domain
MHLTPNHFAQLAQALTTERKRQGLTRSQTAAVCNVSPSFIRDAESHPERCSLEKLALLVCGLGLTLSIEGWTKPPANNAQGESA